VKPELRIFLDTSALFAAVVSTTGGSREILRLGEAGLLRVTLGPMVLSELDSVLNRKSPRSRAYIALLLDRSGVWTGPEASLNDLERAKGIVRYRPDAQIIAEALAAQSDYLVTYDREHMLENPLVNQLPFPAGTAGDFLGWFREYWLKGRESEG
jgi:predicted nucleic acid-binding protein